jgi:hypothetical protein
MSRHCGTVNLRHLTSFGSHGRHTSLRLDVYVEMRLKASNSPLLSSRLILSSALIAAHWA